MTKKYDSTLARIAGNILGPIMVESPSLTEEACVQRAVRVARMIVAEVQATEPVVPAGPIDETNASWKCPACGQALPSFVHACNCAAAVRMERVSTLTWVCTQCQLKWSTDVEVCTCGQRLTPEPRGEQRKGFIA